MGVEGGNRGVWQPGYTQGLWPTVICESSSGRWRSTRS